MTKMSRVPMSIKKRKHRPTDKRMNRQFTSEETCMDCDHRKMFILISDQKMQITAAPSLPQIIVEQL